MKIKEMAYVFLNSANFASHAFLTLAPTSGYALNLKALIKVSKVSWTSHLSYEMLRSSFERKFDKTNFISPKKTPPKSPHLLGKIVPYFRRFRTMSIHKKEQLDNTRDLSRDDCKEEFIKRIWSSGLVWAVGLQSGLQWFKNSQMH